MGADTRQRTTWGNRFRFLLRAAGLTGVVAVILGSILFAATMADLDLSSRAGVEAIPTQLQSAWNGDHGEPAKVGAWMIAGGAVAVLIALVVELLGALILGVGRRTVAGTVATVGMVAAVVLLVLVNLYSFTHHKSFDFTRDQRFTLPQELTTELGKLRANTPTTIVVLQKHKMFGTLSDERDSYTKAAEEKVTEKVKDLVDQFRVFGPQFHVAVLDTEAFGYQNQLDELTKMAPELKAAIEEAPENSIFFSANKRVQRLAFNEFMQLDKAASREHDGGQANLVLIPQGVDRFARRILAVQERRPKVAVCVVHEWLTTVATPGQEDYSLAGLKKSLTDQGFDVVDIVLKKNWSDNTKELEPAAYSLDENKLERLEGDADSAREALRAARDDVRILAVVKKAAEDVQKRPWEDRADFYNSLVEGTRRREWTELLAAFRKWSETRRPVQGNEDEFKVVLFAGLAAQAARAEEQVKEAEKDVQDAEAKLKSAYQNERAIQDRREPDVKAKFSRLLADVDLLIIPRYTVVNATIGRSIPATLHTLDRQQVAVAKEFMKAGKPVLACMGPISSGSGPQLEAIDGFEKLLRERGIELGRETILYDTERKAFTAARAGVMLFAGGATEPPPLLLVEGVPPGSKLAPNPIATALQRTGRTAELSLAMKLRAPRPVYLAPGWENKVPFVAEFLLTPPGAWNETRPFITQDRAGRVTYIPRYEPTPADDPKRNTHEEERKTSFPIAVAIESKIPAAWINEDYDRQEVAAAILTPMDSTFAVGLTIAADQLVRPNQRTVVFGSGSLFSGKELTPPQEKLLVHTVNWLTYREDRLPKPATAETPEWHYPRVAMSTRDRFLWRYGTWVGLPTIVAFIGLLAMMIRRVR